MPITVNVAGGVAIDTLGNRNSEAVQNTQPVDTLGPTVVITDNNAGTAAGDVTFTFTFNEDVTGFEPVDVMVTPKSLVVEKCSAESQTAFEPAQYR